MKKCLSVERLCIRHVASQRALVKEMHFVLPAGESLVILGQSGCGKTMTCHALMGILETKRFAVSGAVLLDGEDLLAMKPRERRKICGGKMAMIPQNPMTAFDPSVRVGRQMQETLALHMRLSTASRKEKTFAALESVGFSHPERIWGSYPFTLSGGMLQRVCIAMAKMTGAQYIIADEPTTALDVVHRNATVESFMQLRSQGASILLVTHDFSVAKQLGGRLIVMKDGEALEEGDVHGVLRSPAHPYTRALIAANRLSRKGENT